MFSLGKKKDSAKHVGKEVDEDNEFNFDDEGDLPFTEEDETPALMKNSGSTARPSFGSLPLRTTLLIGICLLLAIGGGGYYYLSSSDLPAAPVPAASPAKKKMAVPPAAPAAAKPAQPAPVAVAAKPANVAPSATPAAVGAAAPVAPVTAAKVAPAKTPAPSVATGKATPEKAAVATAAPVKAVAPKTSPVPVAAVNSAARGAGAYTLVAGSFLNQEYQRETEEKIRKLGYKPQSKIVYRETGMTRLRVGVYDAATAEARYKELSAQFSNVFTMKHGEQVGVYAGSYQDIEQARSYADKLLQRGIRVEEEKVQLRMPLKTISFGSFASRDAALKVVKRAKAAGLTTEVVKR